MTKITVDFFSQPGTPPFSINALLLKKEVVQNESRSEVVVHAPHILNSWTFCIRLLKRMPVITPRIRNQ